MHHVSKVSWRIGERAVDHERGYMSNGMATDSRRIKGDERTAELSRCVIVVLSRFEAERPADTAVEDGGIDHMVMSCKHAVDTRCRQGITKAVGSMAPTEMLVTATEIAVLPCDIHTEDIEGAAFKIALFFHGKVKFS